MPTLKNTSLGMVRASKTTIKQPRLREWDTSLLGRLDYFPVEVLHNIFDRLDCGSLYRLSLVSCRGEEVLVTLRSYSAMKKHASDVLAALSEMRILHIHSASTLYAALTSGVCVSCGNVGAFIQLLTSQRCCQPCLSHNQALWVMPKSVAAKCFRLSAQQMKSLPSARSIPGEYCVRAHIKRNKPHQLVSVRDVMSLALKLWGSMQPLTDCLREITRSMSSSNPTLHYWVYILRTKLTFENHDPHFVASSSRVSKDFSNGMASMPFSFVLRIWLYEEGEDMDTAIQQWTRTGFLAHSKVCSGITQMLAAGPRECQEMPWEMSRCLSKYLASSVNIW